MITPEYCQTMARYNAWQNEGLRKLIPTLSVEELTQDRGAFFGSIFATLNHLLGGDWGWISLFDGGDAPTVPFKEHMTLTPTAAVWSAERFRLDARIIRWADALHAVDLVGDLEWYVATQGRQMAMSKALCVAHFFNHQTHHRGQGHAMLTAAGYQPEATDLPLLPQGG